MTFLNVWVRMRTTLCILEKMKLTVMYADDAILLSTFKGHFKLNLKQNVHRKLTRVYSTYDIFAYLMVVAYL